MFKKTISIKSISFLLMLVNTTYGVTLAEPLRRKMALVFGANKLQIFYDLFSPRNLISPNMFWQEENSNRLLGTTFSNPFHIKHAKQVHICRIPAGY